MLAVGGVALVLLSRGAATPPPPVAAAGGGFAAIKARGVLRVAADPDAAPFLSRTADGGYEGFEYGLATAIASSAGVPVTFVPSTFAELDGRITGGQADLALGQMSPTNAWAGLAWSVSYLQYSLCLAVPARSSVHHLADLRGKRVGMYDDPVATQLASVGIGAEYERVLFSDYGYFEKLARNQLDAMIYDCPLARSEMKTFGDQVRIADDALNVATYNVALPAADTALKTDVDRVLKSLGDQGLLARLATQWLGDTAPTEGYATVTGRVVVVRRGDTLASIAARELGSAERWKELHEKNRDVIGDDPDALYAGLRLRVGP
jgi:ABC-type amino acid transport substrate-binding protein